MIPELGHFCLILAFVMAAVQALAPASQIKTRSATLTFLLLGVSFLSLIWGYITSDFTIANVAQNSHTLKPMLYKISGVWSNHEGSMLLWVLILGGYGLALARDKKIGSDLKDKSLRVQGILVFGFLGFILFTSNPFLRLYPPPLDGMGLNPMLQDIGLALHPPLLYMGYVGFSAVFSLAIAALLQGEMDRGWARTAKPYVLFAWAALTGGISLGSWWAYYELGWGGWWFWDPVENASLMPWILGTALLHSVIVLEKRGGLQKWTSLLAILTFSLSMLGTFLVRSGVLTSVHAFASDPARGFFILCLLSIFTGGALLVYALKVHKLENPPLHFSALSRETSIILNNLFMVTACATVLIGTLYPLFMDALDMGAISVGAPYFNTTLVPLALPVLLLMGVAPYLAWKKVNIELLLPRLSPALLLTLTGTLLIIIFTQHKTFLAISALILALWLLVATANEWIRARNKTMSHHGMSLSHIGMAIAIFGMVGSTLWLQEDIKIMKAGDQMDIGRYTLRLEGFTADFAENYAADTAIFKISHFGASQPITILKPQRRYYPVAQQTTTEAAIYTTPWDDLYIAIGKGNDNKAEEWIVRAYAHPLIPYLWIGFFLITLGGIISFSGKNYINRS